MSATLGPLGALPAAVLFDLDGTLVDTAPEITDAVNEFLGELGRPRVTEELVREWIGDGTRVLFVRALAHAGIPESETPPLWPRFEQCYSEHSGQHSTPYPGAHAALMRLQATRSALAIVTNKEARHAEVVLGRHDLRRFFSVIVGGDTLPVRKPDAAVVHYALRELGMDTDRALLIGDSVVDVRTARAAGIAVWAVRHGYHHGRLVGADAPDQFIEHFDELDPGPPAPRATLPGDAADPAHDPTAAPRGGSAESISRECDPRPDRGRHP